MVTRLNIFCYFKYVWYSTTVCIISDVKHFSTSYLNGQICPNTLGHLIKLLCEVAHMSMTSFHRVSVCWDAELSGQCKNSVLSSILQKQCVFILSLCHHMFRYWPVESPARGESDNPSERESGGGGMVGGDLLHRSVQDGMSSTPPHPTSCPPFWRQPSPQLKSSNDRIFKNGTFKRKYVPLHLIRLNILTEKQPFMGEYLTLTDGIGVVVICGCIWCIVGSILERNILFQAIVFNKYMLILNKAQVCLFFI